MSRRPSASGRRFSEETLQLRRRRSVSATQGVDAAEFLASRPRRLSITKPRAARKWLEYPQLLVAVLIVFVFLLILVIEQSDCGPLDLSADTAPIS
ncbi:hypothetical protein A1Q1_06614 [Trichosporon asahii var. asahii CBS 2479]|uniref:Uncharacterized protein n=1 Tax=Trichosporon asahii var. asahii (strain ATCC 90039 / CBS 2479 / JCM 2466 / KCTC 7840 / NBRC 103889/ NCYC 2677 / UAMH 7654) TaxID=1186058 RepID=J4U552_TRIAS|nr:hypothetical protein A1Q1_06614 [Trichosporon asahii var. asahii CBS 2479]EJT45030.1 hypothetical protein A1Q1_06614 [Trichosporon asahii var. asahii CBS 2479]